MISNPGTVPPGPHRLVWSEEFIGPAGSTPDNTKFGVVVGGGGWGNNELQTYTNRAKNVQLDGNSNLVVTACTEIPAYDVGDGFASDYSSGKLQSKSRFTFTYGRVDARIKIPAGRGFWPGFWMLGSNIDTTPWPGCGEIDGAEWLGHEPQRVYHTIHGPNGAGNYGVGANKLFTYSLADDFHVYSVLWSPGRVQWSVDGTVYAEKTQAQIPAGAGFPFDHPFYLLLNLSVGGNFPGSPDGTTPFPSSMLVDYVRVYQ